MAFTSTAPSGRPSKPEHSGEHGIQTERSIVVQAVWLWLGGVVVITVLAIALALHAASNRPAEGEVTVGDAMSGIQPASEAEESEAASGTGVPENPGYRLVELASALGLPNGAVPDGAMEIGMDRDEARVYLMELVNKAVIKGVLTPVEADGVIKAFEAGLITAPVNITEDDEQAQSDAEEDQNSDVGSSIESSN
ncbi:hypothetical protein [Corynebacterium casei]|uniref:Secreted protein n=2 Tax=Corynebacterium casei TaxID=160386 RepID=A0ABN4CBA5_9CORY|nr:hypothetical protein [Corynebacterium casei]AHI19621.1 hypothetical protein CCASEI_05225 [Corynebacterium casei LMG S-19264]MDN5785281.1 hypothetical protein [Corynebacterium casei]MDN5827120.1 hypothetical protein [Corynebacterium casei]MDN5884573.1 hypothetical protein [Corynebacterium casei]MDN6131244.1 hypothetical protein [Corynebacterium casei]